MSVPTSIALFTLLLAPNVLAAKLRRDFVLDSPDTIDLEKGTTVIEYALPYGFNSSNTIRVHARFLPGRKNATFEAATFVAVYGETSLNFKITNETRSGSCTLCFTDYPQYENLTLIASAKEAAKVELTLKSESIKLRLTDHDEHGIVTNVTVTDNNPVTFLVDPAFDVDAERNDRYMLLVKDVGSVDSKNVCIIVGAYSNTCPFKDNAERIRNSEIWFTMLERGAMTIRSETHHFNSAFYISLLVMDDAACRLPDDLDYDRATNRTKELSVSIVRMKPYDSYTEPIVVAAFVCLVLAIMAMIIMGLKTYGKDLEEDSKQNETAVEGNGEVASANQMVTSVGGGAEGADVIDGDPDAPQSMQPMMTDEVRKDIEDLKQLCIGALPEGSTRMDRVTKAVMRLNKKAKLSDMTQILKEDTWFRRNRSRIYCYLVPLLSLFYAIPSLQYVFLVKKSENMTGTLDLCFHNFECSKPFNVFSDFNHVISNLSYLIFGLAFIACVAIKSHRLPKNQNNKNDHTSDTGILQQLSIFYAMGFAVIFQGLFSVCYHVCPTNHSLQFDSTMMYVMLMLGCVKIYQFRHPDANANAYSFFYTLAAILMVEAITLYTSSWIIYILFILFYIGMTIFIAVDCYYVGIGRLHHKIGWVLAKQMIKKPCSPRYKQRFFFAAVFIFINVLHAVFQIYDKIRKPHKTITSVLLVILAGNLFLYMTYYALCKNFLRFRSIWPEKCNRCSRGEGADTVDGQFAKYYMNFNCCGKRCPVIISAGSTFALFAIILAVIAASFYLDRSANRNLSPAESRGLNEPCGYYDFYDNHDVWHFASAAAIFFAFLAMLTMDDDMITRPKSQIEVY